MPDISQFSTDPNLVNAAATVASVVVGVAALLISLISLFVARSTLRHQRRHDVLSVRPLAYVHESDHQDRIKVSLCNHGIGPMIIRSFLALGATDSKALLINWMPQLPVGMKWKTFAPNIIGRSVPAGEEIALVWIEGDEHDLAFAAFRDECRRRLAGLRIYLEYTDMYDTALPPYEKELSWFQRHQRLGEA